MSSAPPVARDPRLKMAQSLVLGGILPIIAFTVIEEQYGTLWGLVAGMVFGVGEILYEWRTRGRVDPMTWGGNGLILMLGGVSLITQEGIWFKLQPSLIEGAMALALWVSVLMRKPILVSALRKQLLVQGNQSEIAPIVVRALGGMTVRVGIFFALHAALAGWAALHWSTSAWATLKGVGFTVSMIVYMVAESLLLRYRIAQSKIKGAVPPS